MRTPPPDDPVELGIWVLDHGLPPLPLELKIDETVPIARWTGPEYGAVLFVSWYLDDEEGESTVDADVQTYRRCGGAWVPSEGSGGGSWFDEPLKRPDVPEEYAAVGHYHFAHGATGSCGAAYGVAAARRVRRGRHRSGRNRCGARFAGRCLRRRCGWTTRRRRSRPHRRVPRPDPAAVRAGQ